MSTYSIQAPFFMFNPKSYMYGEHLYDLAGYVDKLAIQYNIDIFFTAPFAELNAIKTITNRLIITAQHIDGIKPGRGMGQVLPESIYSAGARACVLNHAEKPLKYFSLEEAISRAKELKLITIACASSYNEAKAIALLGPEVILCEPTELIGTKRVSSDTYIKQTIEAIKSIDEKIYVMQGAGISTSEDIMRNLRLGSDGNGTTSSVTEAFEPKKVLKDMIVTTASFR
ncbi:triose-phosphate isomerase [Tetragenococcus solitarius]|uniref:Triose-phosphate isomerase n=1 Tax=Tetragenococcus solitarius TaxID=71453 RepID=A0ABN3Y528_9ENTE|nr:triose-phosphate isomerase [Tetragenococcus solitarius]